MIARIISGILFLAAGIMLFGATSGDFTNPSVIGLLAGLGFIITGIRVNMKKPFGIFIGTGYVIGLGCLVLSVVRQFPAAMLMCVGGMILGWMASLVAGLSPDSSSNSDDKAKQ